MRKTKLLRILFIVIFCLVQASCQGQNKTIVTDKGAAIFDTDNPDNYSYNGYDLSPLNKDNYYLPLEIGSKWLVEYKEKGNRHSKLEFHSIEDTIKGYQKEYIYTGEGNFGSTYAAILSATTMPVLDKEIHIEPGYASNTYFFKGFKSYNEKFDEWFAEELPGDFEDVYNDEEDYTKDISRWKKDEKVMTFIDLKHDKEQNKLNEITFSDGNISQILLKYKYIFECELISALDYDGDGKSDIILRMEKWSDFVENKNKSEYYYLLFLSSEAEEGQLVKHVATRKIESINDLGVGNEE
ncbi:hypothetical protein [Dysgonomonas sp. ZJ709]|uniref:hypothetical protein n=1 Tax=Dysgonomonas sp. ZJ709 TaxID=2709797 RepID=UPI0013ED7383|nr:hypothetical protein [Dysgonomonas sp. ZJ709]